MNKFLIATAFALLSGFAFSAHAVTLQNNMQCSGGTLVTEWGDVQDTGRSIAAKQLAEVDCASGFTGPGQCCSVQYHRSTPKPPAIGFHSFSFSIYQGATLVPTPTISGTPTHTFLRWAGSNSSQVDPQPQGSVTASLVANPASIEKGERSLLTWTSTGARSCTGNFPTGGATSGSVTVTPSATTEYTITCTDAAGGSATACLADGEEVPAGNICSADKTISPSLSSISWSQCCSGKARVTCPAPNEPAEAFCARGGNASGSSSSTGARSATASATVMVSDGTFQVSCRAHPTRAGVGEDVLWSSTVSGPQGTYAYSWSGSDGLSGSTSDVYKKYTASGRKTGRLTVTVTPTTVQSQTVPAVPPVATPGACSTVGWITPVTPCAGVWAPTLDQNNCQNGWQCVGSTNTGGGGGGGGGFFDTIFDSFQLLNFVPTLTVPKAVAATASIVPHTEGEMFTSAIVKADMLANGGVAFTETTFVGRTLASDQVTMDRVCVVLHGAGSTATQIGARGYNSCKNNGIIRYSGGKWESVSGCAGAHLSGSFSCVAPVAPPSAGTCALTITPSTITAGQSATLSWTSTGVTSLTIDRGVGTVTGSSGTRTITPTSSGSYTATGASDSTSTNFVPVTHSETEVYTSAAVIADLAASGTSVGPGIGFAAEKAGMDRVCVNMHGPTSSAETWGARKYNSPGNNQVVRFSGASWSRVGAKSFNSHLSSSLTCLVPQSSTGPTIQCTAASVTVTPATAKPLSKTVDCDNAVTVGSPECSDGIDNDRDGLVDSSDPSCSGGEDDGVYDPNGSESGGSGSAAECSDGIDNNGDGNIDWPDDPGCSSADDNLELSDPAELQLSVNPPLIKKNQQCTITLSARNVATCTLSGSGISRVFAAVSGVISSKEVVTPGLQQTATYILSCAGLDGKTATKKVDCKIAPTFEEI